MVCIAEAMVFQVVMYGLDRLVLWELDHKQGWALKEELMLSNCVSGEHSWDPLGQQGD